MPDFVPNTPLSNGEAAHGGMPPDIGLAGVGDERILIVDRCRINHSAKDPRSFLVVVMDTATRTVLSTAIATESALAGSVAEALKDAIATDPDSLSGLPVACDFCDPAELHSRLDGVTPYTQILLGHGGLRTRSWAERELREAALKINGLD